MRASQTHAAQALSASPQDPTVKTAGSRPQSVAGADLNERSAEESTTWCNVYSA